MMKGLMDRYLSQETVVDHLRIKVEKTEEELMELKAWKVQLGRWSTKIDCLGGQAPGRVREANKGAEESA